MFLDEEQTWCGTCPARSPIEHSPTVGVGSRGVSELPFA
jgi:hypothetical protein